MIELAITPKKPERLSKISPAAWCTEAFISDAAWSKRADAEVYCVDIESG